MSAAYAAVGARLPCSFFFFFNDTATTEIYTLSLHDALPISPPRRRGAHRGGVWRRRAARVRRSDAPPRGAGRRGRQGPRGGDPRAGDRGRRAADPHERGRRVPRLWYAATESDPLPDPRDRQSVV